ncbi:MAG: DedA family protein [Ilumatobacteraceae bacterium]|nr:DedA family protein [Acidimicrobiales bacterium]MCB9393500.1 DedA family protein [Acidimicrobiaceae bacterium]
MLAGIFSWITDLTDTLGDWASNWWFLAVVFTIAYFDSILPVVPSETTVIIAGVAVSVGEADYSLWMVIVCGAVGAFLGDNTAYQIGKVFSPRFERRAERKPNFAARLRWAAEQIRARGGLLLITARFIPGGRTVLTLSSGITRQPRAWFVGWVAIACTIWASYAAGLAYVVGQPFKDNHTAAFWVAFGTALGVNVAIEIVRHVRARKRVRQLEQV